MYKKISSKVVFEHPRLKVEEDEILLPSGEVTHYLRYGEYTGVVVIAINTDEKVLFINEYSYVPDKKLLQLPMGRIEANETPEQSARRELQEETGYDAKKLDLRGYFYKNHRRSDGKSFVFVATDLEKVKAIGEKEEAGIEVKWTDKNQIRDLIRNESIIDTDTLASLMVADIC